MHKRIKITNTVSVSIETFRKKAKEIIVVPTVYHTGIYKWKDDINGINFYCLTIYTFRIVLVVESRYKSGCCS